MGESTTREMEVVTSAQDEKSTLPEQDTTMEKSGGECKGLSLR